MTNEQVIKLKDIMVSDLLQNEWSLADRPIMRIVASKTEEDLFWALYKVAQYIGKRKGYKEEGISDLHASFVDGYWAKVGASYPEHI